MNHLILNHSFCLESKLGNQVETPRKNTEVQCDYGQVSEGTVKPAPECQDGKGVSGFYVVWEQTPEEEQLHSERLAVLRGASAMGGMGTRPRWMLG